MNSIKRAFLFLLFTTSFGIDQSIAQWVRTNGPYASDISCLGGSGTYLFGGKTGGGVFRSTDHGSTWVATASIKSQVNAITNSASNVVVGTDSGSFISSDNGNHWTATGMSTRKVLSFCSSGSYLFAGTDGGVFRSSDDGGSWSPVNTGLPANKTISPIVSYGSDLFAAAYGSGLYRSTDNGANWTNTGLKDKWGFVYYIFSLAVSGTNLFYGDAAGVSRSTDAGASWTPVNTGLLSQYGGQLGYVNAILVSGTNLFAGASDGGVFRSSNQGDAWTAINNGLPMFPYGPRVKQIALSGSSICVVCDVGTYRSSDDGAHWSAINTGTTPTKVLALAVNGGELFAGTASPNGSTLGRGVVRSTDNGASWTEMNAGFTVRDIYALAIHKAGLFAATAEQGAFRSSNSGADWQRVITINANCYSLASVGDTIFAGTDGYNGGVRRSTDNGASWTSPTQGVGSKVLSLTASGSTLFAATEAGGVYRSTNGGAAWALANTGLTSLQAYCLAATGGDVFVGTYRGVFRSTDKGTSWSPINTGLTVQYTDPPVTSFALSGGVLLAGTDGGRVCRYVTASNRWVDVGTGLPANSIKSLAASGAYLYAGTGGASVWRRPLSEVLTGVGPHGSPAYPVESTLEQNYPNPFNPTTAIRYSLANRSHVSLKVFNALSQQVTLLQNGEQEAGIHEVKFDGSGLPSGVYFYRIEAGSFVETKRLVLIR
jgi:ligand-binding sensor domain-containing protein